MLVIRFAMAALLLAASLLPLQAAMRFDELPERVRNQIFELSRACSMVGGRPGEGLEAIEFFDFDEDGTPDIILDESRFPCAGVRGEPFCADLGCYTYVMLSQDGRWRPAFDVVGSYCIDRSTDPARFVTIQRNYRVDGTISVLNVRYRFRRGMAFQEGQGTC